jgi:methylmalonyl-CoA mutase N-terminal domain/subunit
MIAKEFGGGNDFPTIDYATWRKAVESDLKGAPFEKKMFSHTYEDIDLHPIYTEEILPTSGDPSGLPGFPPFVHGAQVLGNSLTGWDIRQEHAAADPAEVNAKIRAARMLWAQVVASCGGDAAAQTMQLHTTTSRRVLATRSPAINILRNTAAGYAGAIAGADATTTVPFDAPVVLSTESTRRNARNTQLILAEECHLNHVVDPAGGSWYVEWYTRQLAEKVWGLFVASRLPGWLTPELRCCIMISC